MRARNPVRRTKADAPGGRSPEKGPKGPSFTVYYDGDDIKLRADWAKGQPIGYIAKALQLLQDGKIRDAVAETFEKDGARVGDPELGRQLADMQLEDDGPCVPADVTIKKLIRGAL